MRWQCANVTLSKENRSIWPISIQLSCYATQLHLHGRLLDLRATQHLGNWLQRASALSHRLRRNRQMSTRTAWLFKFAFCSRSIASFFVLCQPTATAPGCTSGHNLTQVSSRLMCTTTCPGAAWASRKLFHCHDAMASGMAPSSIPDPSVCLKVDQKWGPFSGASYAIKYQRGPILRPGKWALFFPETRSGSSKFWTQSLTTKVSRLHLKMFDLQGPCSGHAGEWLRNHLGKTDKPSETPHNHKRRPTGFI